MKRLQNNLIGIDQGDVNLFSDYETGGEMWTGSGQRERSRKIFFSGEYRRPPNVQLALSLWDTDHSTNMRADIKAENITTESFKLVFATWGDTRFARARINWMAIGEIRYVDDWDVD